jgi:hypothetical protein
MCMSRENPLFFARLLVHAVVRVIDCSSCRLTSQG